MLLEGCWTQPTFLPLPARDLRGPFVPSKTAICRPTRRIRARGIPVCPDTATAWLPFSGGYSSKAFVFRDHELGWGGIELSCQSARPRPRRRCVSGAVVNRVRVRQRAWLAGRPASASGIFPCYSSRRRLVLLFPEAGTSEEVSPSHTAHAGRLLFSSSIDRFLKSNTCPRKKGGFDAAADLLRQGPRGRCPQRTNSSFHILGFGRGKKSISLSSFFQMSSIL